MRFPKEIRKNFISTKKIVCIVGIDELESYIEKKYITKNL